MGLQVVVERREGREGVGRQGEKKLPRLPKESPTTVRTYLSVFLHDPRFIAFTYLTPNPNVHLVTYYFVPGSRYVPFLFLFIFSFPLWSV